MNHPEQISKYLRLKRQKSVCQDKLDVWVKSQAIPWNMQGVRRLYCCPDAFSRVGDDQETVVHFQNELKDST